MRSFVLLLTLCIAVTAAAESPSSWSDWEHGVTGLEQATAEAQQQRRPMLVYFNEDWDGWSRRLNQAYLRTDEFKEFTDSFQRVQIDPEQESEGRRLFVEYGSSVYPALYMVLPGSGESPIRVSPFRGGDEQPIADFIADIRRQVNTKYHRWIHRLAEQGEHEQGMALIAVAMEFDPGYPGFHGLRARLLHVQAEQRLDTDLLEQAKAGYREALRLNPGDETSRYWLRRLGGCNSTEMAGEGEAASVC